MAIIATLAVFALSAVRHFIQRGRIAGSSANLRSLVVANMSYETDHGFYCPADDQFNRRRWCAGRKTGETKFDPTAGLLAPYLGQSRSVGICPLLREIVDDGESFELGTGGYGYNSSYIGGRPGGSYDPVTKLRVSEKAANVWSPATTLMFGTTAYAMPSGVQEYPFCEPPFWDFGSGPSGQRPSPSLHFRANGKALVAWCDGHVSAESRRESPVGTNPHGGDASGSDLGWFGREQNNGPWNSRQ